MTSQEATLSASFIAAAVSLVALFVANRANRAAEVRTAQRALLADTLAELGALLYELVALSKKMTQSKKDETFEAVRRQADSTAKNIDELRRKTRYALWGIDGGFRTIQWMPVYVAHHKDNRTEERASKIIKLGTSLRVSMDAAIMHAYISGGHPTWLQRLVISLKAWRLRTYFDDGKPIEAQKDSAESSHS
jgi:hypothetical protein